LHLQICGNLLAFVIPDLIREPGRATANCKGQR
jgi:hypothetical protein